MGGTFGPFLWALQKVSETNRRAELLICMKSLIDQEIVADSEDFQDLEKIVKSCVGMQRTPTLPQPFSGSPIRSPTRLSISGIT